MRRRSTVPLSPSSTSHHSLSLNCSITTLLLWVTITIFFILTPSLHAYCSHFPHSSTPFIVHTTAKKTNNCRNWLNCFFFLQSFSVGAERSQVMDPPLVNEASFTAAANPNSYSLAGLLSFPGSGGLGLRMGNLGRGGGGDEESTVTEQSGSGNGPIKRRRDVRSSLDDGSSKFVSTSSANQDVSESNGKRWKVSEFMDQSGGLKSEAETNSGTNSKPDAEKSKHEPPKDYIHVRARRGQATDSHSLAERARREKISERMKLLQDLVPGCNKVIGKALVLDEIINYIQSLQRQVEFLSMKLEAVNARSNPTIEGFPSKDVAGSAFDANRLMYGSQTPGLYAGGSQVEWLHMQVGGGFER